MRKKKSETKWAGRLALLWLCIIYLVLCHLIKPEPDLSPFEIYSEQR